MVNLKNALKVGTVASAEKNTIDVTYDNDEPDDDDVPRKSVVAILPPADDDRLLFLTTYLNLARCALNAHRPKDAVTCATLASGVASADNHQDHLLTAKILRARAHLAQSHLKQAIRDVAFATNLDKDDKQVIALNRDLEKLKRQSLKVNKRLAKDVTEWVTNAQSKFAESGGNEADCNQQ